MAVLMLLPRLMDVTTKTPALKFKFMEVPIHDMQAMEAVPLPSSWLSIYLREIGMSHSHISMADHPTMCRRVAEAIPSIPFHPWFAWFQVLLSRSTQYKEHTH